MTRYIIEGSPISVAYGVDHFNGIFLSVYDDRLKYDESASDEVNSILLRNHSVGGGSYFELHTGEMGFGHRVSKSAMEAFFRRFGVPEKHINQLLHNNK